MQGNQLVKYDKESLQISYNNGKKCIEGNVNDHLEAKLVDCDARKVHQKWIWGFVNETALEDWANTGVEIL
jgi:hypothetical protein